MPEICKQATVFFRAVDRSVGWTERYFLSALTYDAALIVANEIAVARAALMRNDVEIPYIRVSDIGIRGDAVVASPSIEGTFQPETTLDPLQLSTEPWSALNLRLEAGPLYRGRKFLHGIPQSVVQGKRIFLLGPFEAPLAALRTILLQSTVLWVRDKTVAQPAEPLPPVMVRAQITDVVPIALVNHRIGRPFGLQVGRRPTR